MVEPVELVRCTKCGRWLPADSFPPHKARHCGRSSNCHRCHRIATAAWRAANPEYVAALNVARRTPPTKLTCVECGGGFEGRPDRLVCSRRCKDRRYQRAHPEAYRAAQRRKGARARARLKEQSSGSGREKPMTGGSGRASAQKGVGS
jgi:hypothetical protein